MCFSAEASFTASGVLTVFGIIAICKMKSKRLLPLALSPLFFAIQQAAEGFVWLNLPNSSIETTLFLFFAFAFWPTWGPFSVWIAEKNEVRKGWISFFLGMGFVVSLLLGSFISNSTAVGYNCSIRYYINTNTDLQTFILLTSLYVIAGTVPFFISSLKESKIFGTAVLLGAAVVAWIDLFLFASIWCFYMALISIFLIRIVSNEKN